jgi:hypothetical protein
MALLLVQKMYKHRVSLSKIKNSHSFDHMLKIHVYRLPSGHPNSLIFGCLPPKTRRYLSFTSHILQPSQMFPCRLLHPLPKNRTRYWRIHLIKRIHHRLHPHIIHIQKELLDCLLRLRGRRVEALERPVRPTTRRRLLLRHSCGGGGGGGGCGRVWCREQKEFGVAAG